MAVIVAPAVSHGQANGGVAMKTNFKKPTGLPLGEGQAPADLVHNAIFSPQTRYWVHGCSLLRTGSTPAVHAATDYPARTGIGADAEEAVAKVKGHPGSVWQIYSNQIDV
jgi:hypothetical protein